MNKVVTSKEELLDTARQIVFQEGISLSEISGSALEITEYFCWCCLQLLPVKVRPAACHCGKLLERNFSQGYLHSQ